MKIKATANAGFTLIELMVGIAIFSVVVAGVIGAFYQQLKSHNSQQQQLEIQQNARAAMYFITRELRMAGYDPTGKAGAGITSVAGDPDRNSIRFTMDITGGEADGKDNDHDGPIDAADAVDEAAYGDGATDDADEDIQYILNGSRIQRVSGGVAETVADNIEVLDFVVHGVDPADATNTADRLTAAEVAANPDNPRFVNVAIIARAAVVPVVGYRIVDRNTYRNIDGDLILNKQLSPDNFRRIMLRGTIKVRNMGLD